jgi:hypothetical protein
MKKYTASIKIEFSCEQIGLIDSVTESQIIKELEHKLRSFRPKIKSIKEKKKAP